MKVQLIDAAEVFTCIRENISVNVSSSNWRPTSILSNTFHPQPGMRKNPHRKARRRVAISSEKTMQKKISMARIAGGA